MDPEKDELLMQVVTGDLSSDEPRVQAALEDPEFAQALTETTAILDALEEPFVMGVRARDPISGRPATASDRTGRSVTPI